MGKTEMFKSLWLQGVGAKDIRDACGLSTEHYVYAKANALGLPKRERKGPFLYQKIEPHLDDLAYALEAKLSIPALAAEIGVSRTYPHALLKKAAR